MTYVRVKQAETGHELSLPKEHVSAVGDDAYMVLDKAATDEGGAPLPPKYHTTVAKKAADKTTGGQQVDTEKEKS